MSGSLELPFPVFIAGRKSSVLVLTFRKGYKKLKKGGGGVGGAGLEEWKSFQILSEMAELSPRDSTLRLFGSSEEDQEVT